MGVEDLIHWFAGGERHYMKLTHCMAYDWGWIALTVALDLGVASGYLLIARHWWRNQRRLPTDSPPRRALARMRNIFVFCGLCGYVFIPIKLFWPAWRLYDLFMIPLVYLTWRYALDSRDLRVVYNEIERSDQLARDLAETRDESRRKTEFLNAVSHDLSTPLNGLSLAVTLAEDQLDRNDVEGLRGSLASAQIEIRAASELLQHFLELGRIDWSHDTLNIAAFSLNECLAELLERIAPSAERKGLGLRLAPMPALRILTDRLKLERIVLSFLNNAVRYSDRGEVEVGVTLGDRAVEIQVRDTGIGIAADELARIFDDFYQANNPARDRTRGHGLGLAIGRRLAQRIGGELVAESVVGRGSRFALVLPRDLIREPTDAEPPSRGRGVASSSPQGPDR
jgi:signal transduction histidine kinase